MPNKESVQFKKSISIDWITDSYLPNLSQEKASALDQLHNATNWGLTLVTTALVIIISRQGFPDSTSLYILLITFVMGNHFFTRTLKGYINVIRWSLLQRVITEAKLQESSQSSPKDAVDLSLLIEQYHLKWLLPLRKSDVFIKGLFELGYGYILGAVIATLIYTVIFIPLGLNEWIGIVAGIATLIVEIILLLRSPYMKMSAPNESARRMK